MAHGDIVIEIRCLGTFTGTIVKLFDDEQVSVQLDDGRIEFADYTACGGDDELFEGQEVTAALMQFGGTEPKLMVFAYQEDSDE